MKPTSSSLQPPSSEQITTHERKWLDIEPTPERYGTLSHDISKRMIALLRREQNVLREDDGAMEFCRLKRDLNAKFPYSVRWSGYTWVDHPKKRRRTKEEIPVMHKLQWISNSSLLGYPRSFGRNYCGSISNGKRVDSRRLLRIHYHIGSMHSIFASGLIAGGRLHGRDRQTVFFAADDRMEGTHFGQSNFGQSNFGQSNFGQSIFGHLGFGRPILANPIRSGCVCHGGAQRVGAQNFAKRWSPQMCAFGVLWLLCEAPPAPKLPGFHTTVREPKRAHLRVLAFENTTKIQREDTR